MSEKYQIVEKDIEEEIGYLYPKVFESKEEASEYAKEFRKKEGLPEYLDLFVVEWDLVTTNEMKK